MFIAFLTLPVFILFVFFFSVTRVFARLASDVMTLVDTKMIFRVLFSSINPSEKTIALPDKYIDDVINSGLLLLCVSSARKDEKFFFIMFKPWLHEANCGVRERPASWHHLRVAKKHSRGLQGKFPFASKSFNGVTNLIFRKKKTALKIEYKLMLLFTAPRTSTANELIYLILDKLRHLKGDALTLTRIQDCCVNDLNNAYYAAVVEEFI